MFDGNQQWFLKVGTGVRFSALHKFVCGLNCIVFDLHISSLDVFEGRSKLPIVSEMRGNSLALGILFKVSKLVMFKVSGSRIGFGNDGR